MPVLTEDQKQLIIAQANQNIVVFESDYESQFTFKFLKFIYHNKGSLINGSLTRYAVEPKLIDGIVTLDKLDYYKELEIELIDFIRPIYSNYIASLRN